VSASKTFRPGIHRALSVIKGAFKLLMSDPTHDRFVHGTFIIKDRGND
jgi:hypothetical protein